MSSQANKGMYVSTIKDLENNELRLTNKGCRYFTWDTGEAAVVLNIIGMLFAAGLAVYMNVATIGEVPARDNVWFLLMFILSYVVYDQLIVRRLRRQLIIPLGLVFGRAQEKTPQILAIPAALVYGYTAFIILVSQNGNLIPAELLAILSIASLYGFVRSRQQYYLTIPVLSNIVVLLAVNLKMENLSSWVLAGMFLCSALLGFAGWKHLLRAASYRITHPVTASELEKYSTDVRPEIRYLVAEYTKTILDPRYIGIFANLCFDEDIHVARRAQLSLMTLWGPSMDDIKIPSPALQQIKEHLKDMEVVLGRELNDHPEYIDALAPLIKTGGVLTEINDKENIRLSVARIISNGRNERAYELVDEAVSDSSVALSGELFKILGAGGHITVPLIKKHLQGENTWVTLCAIDAFFAAAQTSIQGRSSEVITARASILSVLSDRRSGVRGYALRLTDFLSETDAFELLKSAATDASWYVRSEALQVLEERFPGVATAFYLHGLSDQDAHVRLIALKKLQKNRLPGAEPLVKRLVEDPNSEVAKAACEYLEG